MTVPRPSNASNLRGKRLEIGYWSYLEDDPQLVWQVKRRATKIRPKAVGRSIFGRFPNFNKYRSEVTGDVISGVAVDCVDVDVRVAFGESGLDTGRIILQPTGSN